MIITIAFAVSTVCAAWAFRHAMDLSFVAAAFIKAKLSTPMLVWCAASFTFPIAAFGYLLCMVVNR